MQRTCANCGQTFEYHQSHYIPSDDIVHLQDHTNFIRGVQVNSIQATLCFDCYIKYTKGEIPKDDYHTFDTLNHF